MVESQRKVIKPEFYERLIDRLGLALDAAKTAGRLRDERPAELELRGLSAAEFELIQAYLDRSGQEAPQGAGNNQVTPPQAPHSAKIIWLRDKAPNSGGAVKVRFLQFK